MTADGLIAETGVDGSASNSTATNSSHLRARLMGAPCERYCGMLLSARERDEALARPDIDVGPVDQHANVVTLAVGLRLLKTQRILQVQFLTDARESVSHLCHLAQMM